MTKRRSQLSLLDLCHHNHCHQLLSSWIGFLHLNLVKQVLQAATHASDVDAKVVTIGYSITPNEFTIGHIIQTWVGLVAEINKPNTESSKHKGFVSEGIVNSVDMYLRIEEHVSFASTSHLQIIVVFTIRWI
jgi:hypothetical protein